LEHPDPNERRWKHLAFSTANRLLLIVYTLRRSENDKETKRRSASSAPGARAARNGKPIPDSDIDFSDIPESTDEELKRARRVGRPRTGHAKDLIAIRISPRLLQQLRRLAAKQNKPYQTLIHELLEDAAKRVA